MAIFSSGYIFKWLIVYLTPNDQIAREFVILLYQGYPPYKSFWTVLKCNEYMTLFYWKNFMSHIKTSHIIYGHGGIFFFKLLGLPPLYYLYVQINSLTCLAPQESFVLKILITSHICICSWEGTPRLIWVFAGRTLILLVLSCCGSFMHLVYQRSPIRIMGNKNQALFFRFTLKMESSKKCFSL